MQHKWAYCGAELGKILENVGFEDVEQQAAQFHAKERRDMRMVGYKSLEEDYVNQ